MKKQRNDSDSDCDDKTSLIEFCQGRFAGLERILRELVVSDLGGFTLALLMDEVERKGCNRMLVPPFLQQEAGGKTLESRLKQETAAEPVMKKAKGGESLDEALKRLIPDGAHGSGRRKSLDEEKDAEIPSVSEAQRAVLGQYLKFVNREKSIKTLLKHASEQYEMYLTNGFGEKGAQFAACSGGPGLGKTTFCRKAFLRAAEVEEENELWQGMNKFRDVVIGAVNAGSLFQISYGRQPVAESELKQATKSIALRILGAMRNEIMDENVLSKFDATEILRAVLEHVGGGSKESFIVVNLDETNVVMDFDLGKQYFSWILTAFRTFNARGKGFVYCILSGTNVQPLHELLQTTSSKAPLEIPLPLLEPHHVREVIWDLANRKKKKKKTGKKVPESLGSRLDFVIEVLGGVPRYVEVLVFLLGKNADGTFTHATFVKNSSPEALEVIDAHAKLEQVKDAIISMYGTKFQGKLQALPILELVAASLFEFPVLRSMKFGDKTVGKLETDGVLFVQGREGENATIRLPWVFLVFAALEKNVGVPLLIRNLEVRLSSDQNEQNSLAILALKCQGLTRMGRPVSVGSLFGDAGKHVAQGLKEAKLEFSSFQVEEAASQIKKDIWQSWEPQLREKGAFVVNAKSASFADMMIVPKGGGPVIFLQEKQREVAKRQLNKGLAVPTMSLKAVQAEHKKCDIEGLTYVFVLITDEDFADDGNLAENEIVVTYLGQKTMIGSLLQLLRSYNHLERNKISLKKK